MISIQFVQHDGEVVDVNANAGDNLMAIARDHDVAGILAECGGACACATCHCIPGEEWQSSLPDKSDNESMILEGAFNVEERSRLACQITIDEKMNGMKVIVPEGIY